MVNDIIDIYYFTGTGNTLRIIEQVKKTLEDSKKQVHLYRIEKSDPTKISLDHTIGLAFPIAFFSTYPLVWQFIEQLPEANGTPIFMLSTKAVFSGGIVGPLKTLLKQKGYQPIGAREFIMPVNYGNRIKSKEENEQKILKSIAIAHRFAEDLLQQKTMWQDEFLLSKILYWLSKQKLLWLLFPGKITIDLSNCISCGLCARLCPTNAITMNDKRPEKNDKDCVMCMRCMSYCPKNTILFAKLQKRYQAFEAAAFLKLLEEKEPDTTAR